MPTLTAEESSVTTRDGVRLHMVRWPLEAGAVARARILIVHGRGEHGGRYAGTAATLAEHGIECSAVDLRGFGKSDPSPGAARGSLRDFEEYVLDVDAAIGKVAKPLFLLGHSAGGLALIRFLETRAQDGILGLILSSPYLGMRTPVPGLKLMIVRGLSLVNPDMKLPAGKDPNTRDEACMKAYLDDPLRVPVATARWLTEVLKHQGLALKDAERVQVPVLVQQGGADTSSDPAMSRRFSELARGHYREYPGCLHEVLNELAEDRKRVLADLSSWVLARAK
jgi:lysophospholipase